MISYQNQWLKLSPVAVIYFAVQFIKSIGNNLIYLLPAILVGYNQFAENGPMILSGIGAILLFVAVSALLKFYFYKYRLTEGRVQIHSGVLQKTHIDLPFERIQNVRFEQPIFYRPTNHICMLLDTAGSSKLEAKVIALPKEVAESLKKEILEHKTERIDSTEPEEPQAEQEELLNSRSIRDLIVHGLASNRIWIVLGALAPFFNSISEEFVKSIESMGVDVDSLVSSSQYAFWQYILFFLSIAFVVIALMALFSILGSVITFYNFKLTRSDDRYIRRNGLFTRHEVVMKLSRLQMIIYQQNWLDRLLQRVNLKFEQLNANQGHQSGEGSSGKIIVPSVTLEEAHHLAADSWPDNKLSTVDYQPVSKRLAVRNTLIAFWLLIPLAGVFAYFGQAELASASVVLFAVSTAFIILSWKRWGYAIDDNFIYLRRGLIGINYRCFPIHKVQQTQFSQSVFMRRFQLCSVKFVLACGRQTLPFVQDTTGRTFIDVCLYRVEALKKSWM
ncbi:PH domain-containing protein [Idiomarina sp. HP20-50]|uniref:PH domain-containing protein n=1 Tax=Idiomarina sp. HP20-50 TaxID=3070813 RepID=UPI00294B2522|nr:PH domain-containing protein [Idiomarina sp. HP20-50]MDV6314837.1 PH domain-containing protein [Idiomarina sp. HP20-50]